MPLDMLTIVAASAVTFLATSLDNLLLLVGFHTSGTLRRSVIALSYGGAVAVVIALSFVLASAADDALPFSLGYLGLAPILIGIHHGVLAFRTERASEAPEEGSARTAVGFVSVFATMLANSGDSLLVFTALLGDTRSRLDVVVVLTLLGMTLAWTWIAGWLTAHPRLQEPLKGFARFGLPILLIGVGLYILTDSPTDVVVAP